MREIVRHLTEPSRESLRGPGSRAPLTVMFSGQYQTLQHRHETRREARRVDGPSPELYLIRAVDDIQVLSDSRLFFLRSANIHVIIAIDKTLASPQC